MGSSVVAFVGIIDAPIVEALACWEALPLVQDLLLPNIIISSDCQLVVGDIAQGTGGQHASIIEEIRVS